MLEKRSFSLSGHRTSVALEPEFWAALTVLAAAGGVTLAGLITRIDAEREAGKPLASAMRVFALKGQGSPCGALIGQAEVPAQYGHLDDELKDWRP